MFKKILSHTSPLSFLFLILETQECVYSCIYRHTPCMAMNNTIKVLETYTHIHTVYTNTHTHTHTVKIVLGCQTEDIRTCSLAS